MSNKPDFKTDFENLFKDFRWTIKGFIDENGKIHELPDIPQVITGIFQELAKRKIKPFLKQNYNCKIIQGGPREYPEMTVFGGKLETGKTAIDVKTTRRVSKNRVSGFSIGSYAGYFTHPDQKLPGCKFPYGEFKDHWVIGFVYTWNPDVNSLHMVSDIEVIVNRKWKLASKSTATGTTFAISSVRDLNALRAGKGDFNSPQEFENFWRAKGLKRESQRKK